MKVIYLTLELLFLFSLISLQMFICCITINCNGIACFLVCAHVLKYMYAGMTCVTVTCVYAEKKSTKIVKNKID